MLTTHQLHALGALLAATALPVVATAQARTGPHSPIDHSGEKVVRIVRPPQG